MIILERDLISINQGWGIFFRSGLVTHRKISQKLHTSEKQSEKPLTEKGKDTPHILLAHQGLGGPRLVDFVCFSPMGG